MKVEYTTDAEKVQDHRPTEVVNSAPNHRKIPNTLARTDDVTSVCVYKEGLWIQHHQETFTLGRANLKSVTQDGDDGIRAIVWVKRPTETDGTEKADEIVPSEATGVNVIYKDVGSVTVQDGGVQLELRGEDSHVFLGDSVLLRADDSSERNVTSSGTSSGWVEINSGKTARSGYGALRMLSTSLRLKIDSTKDDSGTVVRRVCVYDGSYEIWVKEDRLDEYGGGLKPNEALEPEEKEAIRLRQRAAKATYDSRDVSLSDIDIRRLTGLFGSSRKSVREHGVYAVSHIVEERPEDCVCAVKGLTEYVDDYGDGSDEDPSLVSAVDCLGKIAEVDLEAVEPAEGVLRDCLSSDYTLLRERAQEVMGRITRDGGSDRGWNKPNSVDRLDGREGESPQGGD